MTTKDKELESLITTSNSFQKQALDAIDEVEALKAQLALIKRKWEDAQGDISTLFEIQPLNMSDNSYQVDGQCVNDLMKAITQ